MSIEKKPGKLAQSLLLLPIRAFINSRSKVMIKRNDTLDMEGPYLILGNHVTNWDPLIINSYVKEPICFIAGETLFRHRLLKRILDWAGAIPKMKFKNDTRTIRSILKAKKHNRVIGIFPEGNRNWDGVTEPLIYSTAKLVKLLNIPVVIATIRGGHLSHPRWADSHRKGVMEISFEKKWEIGHFKDMSVEEVHMQLTSALAYNEMEWQTEEQHSYKGKNLANYLERLLFVCPHCKTPAHLHSHQDLFQCKQCDYTVRYTEYGTFVEMKHSLIFSTTVEWNKWQLQFLKDHLLLDQHQSDWEQAMQDYVQLFVSDENTSFKLISKGDLSWKPAIPELLHFQQDNGETTTFNISDMEGINIHLHHKLDFFIGDRIYRLVFFQPHTSAYKWLKALQLIQENQKEVEEANV